MNRTDRPLFTRTQIPVCLGFLAKTKVPNASAQSPGMPRGKNALGTPPDGIFVQSEQFVRFDSGKLGNIAVCGLANTTTHRLALRHDKLRPKLGSWELSVGEIHPNQVATP
jgi:hypothetical protein